MGYRKIPNLYKDQSILMFKECYALCKLHGTSTNIRWVKNEHGIWDQYLFAGGIQPAKKFENMMNERFNLRERYEVFLEYIRDWPEVSKVTLYGEGYGGNCQAMSHIYGPLNFAVFEVNVDGFCLDTPRAEKVATTLGFPFVPYERGPATVEWLNEQRNKYCVQAQRNGMGEHHHEGIVVRPIIEVTTNDGKPIIAKHKRDEYAEHARPRKPIAGQHERQTKAQEIAEDWVTQMRLEHVIDAQRAKKQRTLSIEDTGDIIRAMIEDVKVEGEGEIEWTPEASKQIGKRCAMLWKAMLKDRINV